MPAARSGSQPAKSVVAGCQPQGLAARPKVMFVVVDCGFCMLCPCRKADDPPEQTMDPLPTLPDLKRLVFVKDCVCVLMCMYV